MSSCENKYNFQNNNNLDIIVIQAILTNEYKNQTILISKMLSNPTETINCVTDATVEVKTKNHTYTFAHNNQNPGEYISTEKFIATIDNYYNLIVKHNQQQYTAYTKVLPVAPFDSIRFAYDTNQKKYYIDYIAEVFDPFQSAMYQINIDWTSVQQDTTTNTSPPKALTYFFTLKTVDINQIFSPPSEQIFFPESTKVTVTKYSLTPQFEKYIRTMLYETQWAGSLFDVQHGFITTNIEGGAIGFFTASCVYKKEFLVKK